MPFPYLTPISPWAAEVLEKREKNPIRTIYKNPFIVISSAAKIVKSDNNISTDPNERAQQVYAILEGKGASVAYKGCILANSLGLSIDKKPADNSWGSILSKSISVNNLLSNGGLVNLNYSYGKTPVGIDFDGKIITVDGEEGRKVSVPVIESMELETDGANNTLKTAKVTVKCFTLKQLEMFEMFFMKPGMSVLIEFGDNSLDVNEMIPLSSGNPNESMTKPAGKKDKDAFQNGTEKNSEPYKSVTEALVFSKVQNYDEFCENFSRYFRSDTSALAEYLATLQRSKGTYDRLAGKVLEYGFSINDDGTYTATFDVSQGNQISFSVPKSQSTGTGTQTAGTSADIDYTTFDQIFTLLQYDFNIRQDYLQNLMSTHPDGKKAPAGKTAEHCWQDDFYNFLKINKQQKDTVASEIPYVSLRFVLVVLMNYIIGDNKQPKKSFFHLDLPGFRKNATDSSDEDKLLRMLLVDSSPYLISSNTDILIPREGLPTPTQPVNSPDATEVVMDTKNTTKGKINGYNFDMDFKEIYLPEPYYGGGNVTPIQTSSGYFYGNALNIFLNYRKVVEFWKKSYTRLEFLEQILTMVNTNGYGLFQLMFGLPANDSYPVVLNGKLGDQKLIIDQNNPSIYRFKPTTLNSNVKQFSFNFEMSNLVAGMTLFNTRKIITEAKDKAQQAASGSLKLPLPSQAYKSVDNSMYANADGYYSINQVEYVNLEKTQEIVKKESTAGIATTTEQPTNENVTKEATNWDEVIKGKSTKFLINNVAQTIVYNNPDLIYKLINDKKKQTSRSVVSPITVSLTIGGFSGFSSGEYFKTDGVPEIYNKMGVFQINNIKHSLNNDGWSTTIDADYKITN